MKMLAVFVPDMHHKTLHCCDELPLMARIEQSLKRNRQNRDRAAMDNNYMLTIRSVYPNMMMHLYPLIQ